MSAFTARGPGFDSQSGNKDPTSSMAQPKLKKKRNYETKSFVPCCNFPATSLPLKVCILLIYMPLKKDSIIFIINNTHAY